MLSIHFIKKPDNTFEGIVANTENAKIIWLEHTGNSQPTQADAMRDANNLRLTIEAIRHEASK